MDTSSPCKPQSQSQMV